MGSNFFWSFTIFFFGVCVAGMCAAKAGSEAFDSHQTQSLQRTYLWIGAAVVIGYASLAQFMMRAT